MSEENALPEGIYQLATYPDKVLELVSEECTEADLPFIKKMLKPMSHIMAEYNGIGLAAVQVGVLKRFCTFSNGAVTPTKEKLGDIILIINPEIVPQEPTELVSDKEGCLSLPRFYESIARPADVLVKFRDQDWKEVTAAFSGMEARCIQHEIDHMNGILQVSKLGPMAKQMYVKKLAKGRKHGKIRV